MLRKHSRSQIRTRTIAIELRERAHTTCCGFRYKCLTEPPEPEKPQNLHPALRSVQTRCDLIQQDSLRRDRDAADYVGKLDLQLRDLLLFVAGRSSRCRRLHPGQQIHQETQFYVFVSLEASCRIRQYHMKKHILR